MAEDPWANYKFSSKKGAPTPQPAPTGDPWSSYKFSRKQDVDFVKDAQDKSIGDRFKATWNETKGIGNAILRGIPLIGEGLVGESDEYKQLQRQQPIASKAMNLLGAVGSTAVPAGALLKAMSGAKTGMHMLAQGGLNAGLTTGDTAVSDRPPEEKNYYKDATLGFLSGAAGPLIGKGMSYGYRTKLEKKITEVQEQLKAMPMHDAAERALKSKMLKDLKRQQKAAEKAAMSAPPSTETEKAIKSAIYGGIGYAGGHFLPFPGGQAIGAAAGAAVPYVMPHVAPPITKAARTFARNKVMSDSPNAQSMLNALLMSTPQEKE